MLVRGSCQKNVGIYLDQKWTFLIILKKHFQKQTKEIIRKSHNVLPRNSLITIYKSLIQAHLDDGAIIFDQPENESFCTKI